MQPLNEERPSIGPYRYVMIIGILAYLMLSFLDGLVDDYLLDIAPTYNKEYQPQYMTSSFPRVTQQTTGKRATSPLLKALKQRLGEPQVIEVEEVVRESVAARDENYRNNTFNQLFEIPSEKGYLYSLNVHSEVETNDTFDPYHALLTLQRTPLYDSVLEEPRVFKNCVSTVIPGVVTTVSLSQTTHRHLAVTYRTLDPELGQVHTVRVYNSLACGNDRFSEFSPNGMVTSLHINGEGKEITLSRN